MASVKRPRESSRRKPSAPPPNNLITASPSPSASVVPSIDTSKQEEPNMKRKLLRLSESFSDVEDVNLQLNATTSKELFEDPFKSMERAQQWKVKSCYSDIGFEYRDDQAIAYIASRMLVVFSACQKSILESCKSASVCRTGIIFLGPKTARVQLPQFRIKFSDTAVEDDGTDVKKTCPSL